MLLPHGTIVAVADGTRLKLYRNAGSETQPKLAEIPTPKLEVHSSDSGVRHRASSANPDKSRLDEDSFAAATAGWLNHQANEGKIEHLVMVATPKALGELRHHYHKGLATKILAELHKDLIDRPLAELEAALVHAKAS